jgi:hypothetical protein
MKLARALGVALLSVSLPRPLPADGALPPVPQVANEDESRVPTYVLPDPLVLTDGRKVADARTWTAQRRPELRRLFETHVYGRTPAGGPRPRFTVAKTDPSTHGGRAIRKEVTIAFGDGPSAPRMDLLVYLPSAARAPVPVFLALNFQGNHAVDADPGVTLSTRWMVGSSPGIVANRATEASRGSDSRHWPIETIVEGGYGLATAYYGDLFPDRPDGPPRACSRSSPPTASRRLGARSAPGPGG